ncbi:MAG: glycoside hydrolase family 127 protein [Candidatus Helarchaeota archaeon]
MSSFCRLQPVPFEHVEITDAFWARRQKINRELSLWKQYQKLEENHHLNNFRIAAGMKRGVHRGLFFIDSDLYKWLEAASYFLHLEQESRLQAKVDEIVHLIAKAQLKDGYINTFFLLNFPQKRFTNWYVFHELYCAGHLIEAAIAHYNAMGQRLLLKVAEKFADLLVCLYLKNNREGVPGHEELELALIQLYKITGKKDYLKLAKEFLDRRGTISNYKGKALYQVLDMIRALVQVNRQRAKFKEEDNSRNSIQKETQVAQVETKLTLKNIWLFFREHWTGKYAQLDKPIREIERPVGHSVRAMYLYCGMADLYSETGEKKLLTVLQRIWNKMIQSHMYITGGIGAVPIYEGFGKDFELPSKEAYAETCAAIGNLLWNWRMLQITGQAKYADLLELILYNAFLVGQSIDGLQYSYNNPLKSEGDDVRSEWFVCACCPPNVARTIASLGKFIYSTAPKSLWIHQYIGNKIDFSIPQVENANIQLLIETQCPWQGDIQMTIQNKKSQEFTLFLRIPKWSNSPSITINQEKYNEKIIPGNYLSITRKWGDSETIRAKFNLKPILIKGDHRIRDTRGKVALSLGPLIYCFEQMDNEEDIDDLTIPRNPNLKVTFKPNLLEGVNIINGLSAAKIPFIAIPYYAWCNRGPTKMKVWMNSELSG